MERSDINIFIVSFVSIFLLLIIVIFIITLVANKKKAQFILERQEAERAFEKEIELSRIEIQEQDLKNISWELHDNVGQLLSVSKMQLSIIGKQSNEKDQKALDDTIELISAVLSEIRQLSKSLSQDYVHFNGLVKTTKVEIDRFNRLNYLKADLKVIGMEVSIDYKDEILLYRIIQEILSNVIKHAKAQNLIVIFEFTDHALTIDISDDGIGLSKSNIGKGIGFTNMMSRAKLLEASFEYDGEEKAGVHIKVVYPFKKFNKL